MGVENAVVVVVVVVWLVLRDFIFRKRKILLGMGVLQGCSCEWVGKVGEIVRGGPLMRRDEMRSRMHYLLLLIKVPSYEFASIPVNINSYRIRDQEILEILSKPTGLIKTAIFLSRSLLPFFLLGIAIGGKVRVDFFLGGGGI